MKAKLTLIVAALAFSGWALGQDATTDGAAQPDAGIGQYSGSEVSTGLLGAIDQDGDGRVSQDELISYFQQHDANGDGSLDESEFAAFEGGASGGMQMPSDQPASPDTGTMEQSPSDMGTSPDAGVPPASPGATGQ